MTDMTLVGLCGSLRAASTNRLLMQDAARRFGASTFIDGDIRFPLFDEDIQDNAGVPEAVMRLSGQIKAADAVLVVTPEYNKGISGALKNALDWLSRTGEAPWKDKPVAILSAAAGRAGGERAQNMARLCLTPFRPRIVNGPEVMIGATSGQWDSDGRLTDARGQALLDELMAVLRAEAEMLRSRG
jgi:chromate reductase